MSNVLNNLSFMEALAEAKTTAVASLKRNRVVDHYHFGRAVLVKRRNGIARSISRLANFYFHLAHIPISFVADPEKWQQWEISCYRMLNERFRIYTVGPHKVCQDRLPGESLWDHMKRGTLNGRMIEAAAREFGRAHSMWSDYFHGPWSHGDASMCNVLYDEFADRARLIDFEIVHDKSLPAAARHADDLLMCLLDLAGFVSRKRWRELALCFVRTYDDPDVTRELIQRLHPPRGLARIWWHVRSNFKGTAKITSRLASLRWALSRDLRLNCGASQTDGSLGAAATEAALPQPATR